MNRLRPDEIESGDKFCPNWVRRSNMKILSFGEVLWDVYPDERFIGGAPLKFAAHLARHGEDVYMLSALGQDELGEAALAQLKQWQIHTEHVAVLKDRITGQCLVTLDEQFVPTYHLLGDTAYDRIPCDGVPDGFDVLYFGTMALRSGENFASLKGLLAERHFKEVFVDVNIRPPHYSRQTVRFAVEHATIVKISLEEMETVAQLLEMPATADYREFAAQLADQNRNLRYVVITLGGDGAYALACADRQEYACASAKVEAVSTVGAGDSFSAAFLHQYLAGNGIGDCLTYAAKVAGFVVSQQAAVPEYDPNLFA